MPYQSIQSPPVQPTITINPVLDFIRDTAYVAVQMPGECGSTSCGPPLIFNRAEIERPIEIYNYKV